MSLAWHCRELTNARKPVPLALVDKHINILKENYVFRTLWNVLFSNIIFTGKIIALECSIFGTYYAISSHSDSIILAIFLASLSIIAIAFYTISCQLLLNLPDVMVTRKRLCLGILTKQGNCISSWDKKMRERSIRAIRPIGCRDGSFRVLRSVSTLLFIEFYLNQVISLLLL